MRVVHEKLLRLLPGGKQQALTADRVFEPFSGLNPLHYNPYTEVTSFTDLFMCTQTPLLPVCVTASTYFLGLVYDCLLYVFVASLESSSDSV